MTQPSLNLHTGGKLERIAKILPDVSLEKDFEYIIPHDLADKITPGSRVKIPFSNRQITGYVIEVTDEPVFPREKLKPIQSFVAKLIPANLMKLGNWISDYYCASRIHTIRSLLPAPIRNDKVKIKEENVYFITKETDYEKLVKKYEGDKRKSSRILILNFLNANGEATSGYIKKSTGASPAMLKTMLDEGILDRKKIQVERDPFLNEKVVPTTALTLTDEQEESMKLIHACLDSGEKEVVLVQGVTGCGKTEIYLQAIQHCLNKGQQAIVLVPEISLTPQTTQRFRARFGEKVSVLHSRLGDGERYDQWMRIHEGKTSIVVGARSALFAPFENLGLIVVDEEHESSYKQDKAPRYHARDVAVVRAAMEKCTVILGSATPSFESLSNVEKGKYKLSVLKKRADNAVMPKMRLIDMRNEATKTGAPQIFSNDLVTAMRKQLEEGMQTILFLNRRGYATQMQCLKCGYVASCNDCSNTYTFHRKTGSLSCHFCGVVIKAYTRCPECGDEEIRYSGLGTEKVESLCQGIFPYAKIARMDSDSMTRKDDHKNTLAAFQSGEYNILIGTQMIAKGLHFPKVTLVGVIFADLGLHIPDFRAAERTFQLLTQVSGRSGRGAVEGEVLVQSYTPYHPALQYAMSVDTDQFYKEEIVGRQLMNFPPYRQMIIIHFRGPNEMHVQKTADAFFAKLKPYLDQEDTLMPVVPCPVAKIKTLYRYQTSLLTSRVVRASKLLRHMVFNLKFHRSVEVYIDVDPQSLF